MVSVLSSLALQSFANTTGFAAAILTTTAFAPQVAMAWRTGARDLSWVMLAMFGTGVGLWLLYGIAVGSWPVIAGNAVTGLQIIVIGILKAFPRSRSLSARRPAEDISGD